MQNADRFLSEFLIKTHIPLKNNSRRTLTLRRYNYDIFNM